MCEVMSKVFKEALTILIVTHVIYAKGFKHCIQSNVTHLAHVIHNITFLLITFLIFNQFSIHLVNILYALTM